MNVLLEESPAPDLGSVSTRLGVTSASVILVSTSCTLEANINATVTKLPQCLCVLSSYSIEKWPDGVIAGLSGTGIK